MLYQTKSIDHGYGSQHSTQKEQVVWYYTTHWQRMSEVRSQFANNILRNMVCCFGKSNRYRGRNSIQTSLESRNAFSSETIQEHRKHIENTLKNAVWYFICRWLPWFPLIALLIMLPAARWDGWSTGKWPGEMGKSSTNHGSNGSFFVANSNKLRLTPHSPGFFPWF